MIGETLLHYRITDRLGAGGMGEVYLARDEKLNRDVALKVLPQGALAEGEARNRFRKEADALSQLSHPHIATLFDFDSANGTDFLVMELVRGPSVRDEIEKEGALPEKTVVRLGAQLARGLQAAHEKGIVHRDLKPSNLSLTEDGLLKILDFGLARLLPREPEPGEETAATQTAIGKVAGTLLYMSPEQLRGRGVDERSDLYAAGAVLYEMATGKRLFSKPSAAELTEAILNENPKPPRELTKRMSPGLEAVILKALDKDPELRYQTAKDLRADLERLQQRSDSYPSPTTTTRTLDRSLDVPQRRGTRGPGGRERAAWVALALILGGVAALIGRRDLLRSPEVRPVLRFQLDMPESLPLRDGLPVISPDDRHVAFAPADPEAARIWVRSLDSREARALPGTEGARVPFWSPDGGSLAFYVVGKGQVALKRVDLATGQVRDLCAVPGSISAPGSWSRDDTILLSAGRHPGMRIHVVPAAGGEPRVLLEPDRAAGEANYIGPQFLPDGRRFLFTALSEGGEPLGRWVSSLEAPAEKELVLPGTLSGVYSAGHLLLVRDGALLAQPFDEATARLTGDPVVLVSSIATHPAMPRGSLGLFSASPRGSLVYAEQGASGSELGLFDRTGARIGTVGRGDQYLQIQLSPDDQQVAASIGPQGVGGDLWILDIGRGGVATRVTSDPAADFDPVWSTDGGELFFTSTRGEDAVARMYRKRLDVGAPEPLGPDLQASFAQSVSPNGEMLVYLTGESPSDTVWALPLGGDGEPERLMKLDHGVDEIRVSPDGRWLAYDSGTIGTWEVYVTPFRRPGATVRVSSEGGRQPRWRADGRELFYAAPTGTIVAVDVHESRERLEMGLPHELLNAGVDFRAYDQYAVTRDGQRFLVIRPVEETGWSLQVILNWPGLLE